MQCTEFEDLLLNYHELDSEELQATDAHLAACADCRAFLEVLDEVDVSLTELFAEYVGYNASPTFRQSVLKRLQGQPESRGPSFIPEVLDFIGWAAVFAIVAWMVVQVSPPVQLGSYIPWIAGVALFVTGLLFGIRVYADLKH